MPETFVAGFSGIIVGCLLIPLLPWHACYSPQKYLEFWRSVWRGVTNA